jgi:PAS domain S-box-containing protein
MKEGHKAAESETLAVDLRNRAENASREEEAKKMEAMSPDETRHMLHELRVHQIELQMQNDQLRHAQAELDAARARYFDLYDLAPVGYFTLSEDEMILEANLTATTLLGVARDALVKQPISRFILDEDQDIYYLYRKQLLETHSTSSGQAVEPQVCELRMLKKNGKSFWAHLEAATAQDADGAPVCRLVMSDISERKRVEEDIHLNESRLRRLVDILQHPSYTIQDFLDYALDQAIQLTGSKIGYIYHYREDRKEFVLNTWSKEVMASCAVAKPQTCYELDKTGIWGEAVRQRRPMIVNDFQAAHPLKKGYPEGHVQLLNFMTIPIFKGESIVGVVGLANKKTDYEKADILQTSLLMEAVWKVTESKRAEEALREGEEKYRTVADFTYAWEYWLAPDGKYLYVSPACERISGYRAEEFQQNPNLLEKITHPEDRHRLSVHIHDVLQGKSDVCEMEFRIITRVGKECWISHICQDVYNLTGEYLGRRSSNIDITERKKAEEGRQSLEERLHRAEKMEALGLLAGGVAHDLNNVLGIVVGYAELLLINADESSSIRPQLVNIMNGGLKAAAIVDDLLTLARRGVSGREVLNLNKIIADCQHSPEFANLSSHHPYVKIKTELDPDLLNISCSSVHLGKSLFNLVSNASEAMTKGSCVTIRTTNQYLDKPIQGYDQIREGEYAVLSVSDTGEGISADNLKRIFEPFYTKKVMGRSGTGLGLAVVWGTVKDHHGYINVHSEEGKGSIFTLYFPVTREEIAADAVAIEISEYMGSGESILVVDDVKEQRDLAAGMLRKLNYNVASVSSGEEALLYLREHTVDLMLLDMIMDPGMDGLDTYRSILEIHPPQKAIIVSGFSESERVLAARDLGAGAYVRKPYIIEKMGLAVRKELERSE